METHHSYAMQAIEAGKHVLVEKPTAVTIAEIEEIKEAANRKGVRSLRYTIISTNPPSCGPKI